MSPSSTVGRVVGAAGIITGVVGAAALGGLTAQRRAMKRYRTEGLHASAITGDNSGYDALVADRSYSVVAEDGTLLHVEEVGPVDAPLTVVFAHGWMLRSGAWHYQRLALAGPGFGAGDGPTARLVFYDQRSHGRSGRAPAGHSTLDDLAADLGAIIATAAPEGPIVIVGHSMGGMALLTLAGRRPELFAERVVGVALVSTSATQLAQPEISRLVTRSAPVLALLSSVAARYPKPFERGRSNGKDAAWLLTRAFGFARDDVPAVLVDYLDEMISSTPVEVIAEFTPSVLHHNQVDALPALSGIPVVIVCGDADKITPIARSRAIADSLPDAEFVTVPGAGHMAILESPTVVNDALRGMLAAAAAKAGLTAPRARRRAT